ncbi:MAG: FliM/FliN family flagellar motor switch protein [Planctomycetota bacterium]
MSDEQSISAEGEGQDAELPASRAEWEQLAAEVAAEEAGEAAVESADGSDDGPAVGAAPEDGLADEAVREFELAGAARMEQQVAEASPVRFPEVSGGLGHANLPLDRIYDLKVPVSVELGKSTLSIHEILQLGPGSVVELDNTADSPVSMYVHGKRVAMGEIVVVDEYYGVKITSVG